MTDKEVHHKKKKWSHKQHVLMKSLVNRRANGLLAIQEAEAYP